MDRAEVDLLLDTHLRALRDGDVETLMNTVSEDVEYDLVGATPASLRGRDAVRAHHLQEFANTMLERSIPLRRLHGQGFVIDEQIWEGRITGHVGSLVGSGRRVSLRILRVVEVAGDQVTRQTVYTDFAALSRQLDRGPSPMS